MQVSASAFLGTQSFRVEGPQGLWGLGSLNPKPLTVSVLNTTS